MVHEITEQLVNRQPAADDHHVELPWPCARLSIRFLGHPHMACDDPSVVNPLDRWLDVMVWGGEVSLNSCMHPHVACTTCKHDHAMMCTPAHPPPHPPPCKYFLAALWGGWCMSCTVGVPCLDPSHPCMTPPNMQATCIAFKEGAHAHSAHPTHSTTMPHVLPDDVHGLVGVAREVGVYHA